MMRLACGIVVVLWLCTGVAWSQGEIFADGFESGDTSAWADTTYGETMVVVLPGGIQLTLKYVPAGTFLMGSPVEERGRYDQEDLHQVTLTQAYYLGATEVTQVQWEAVTGTPMPTECGSYGAGSDYPVYCVSWNDIAGAGGFVDQLNAYLAANGLATGFRLPTEAEWERGARAGTQTRFSHGDVLDCDDYCGVCTDHSQYMWWCGDQPTYTCQPAGSRLANALALHDLHGNEWEWVQDWFTEHLGTDPVTDPTGPADGTTRVFRGGGWPSDALNCRSASRFASDPSSRINSIGFRLARTAQ